MRLLFLTALCLMAFSIKAQIVISCHVTDKNSCHPIVGANVMIKTIEGKMLAFGRSDKEGKVSIKVARPCDTMTVNVSVLGYKSYSRKITDSSEPIEIQLEDKTNKLEEIVVIGKNIRHYGDTIAYNVGSFAQKQDKSIGDVLKRMPGIDVEDNGKVSYQGVEINKFYIEGSDLLGGKYGIATNGISHDDVGAVEVMENHLPMQVLRNISYSNQAAINLKLKDKSKATLLFHGELGGGWSTQPKGTLWQGEIFAMLVRGDYQMITFFKANNTGKEQTAELADLFGRLGSETISRYTSLSLPSTPNLKKSRSYFNRSWALTSNHLWKLSSTSELKTQINYFNNRLSAKGNSSTAYFLESGDKVVIENRNALSHINSLSGKIIFENNAKSFFLNNTLDTDISWNNGSLVTTGSLPNTLNTRSPEFFVANNLKLIKRIGNKLVTFTSRNEWNSMPETLSVRRDNLSYGQHISQNAFFTDERASLGFIFNGITLSLDAGISGFFRNLRSDLFGLEEMGITKNGAVTTDYLKISASPRFEWKSRQFDMLLSVPLNLYTYFFSKGIDNRTEFFVSPSITATWHIIPQMDLSLSGGASRRPLNLKMIHDMPLMTTYRSFTYGTDDYYTTSGQLVGLSYRYRNEYNLFLNAWANIRWNKSKVGSVREIIDDYVFYSYTPLPSSSRAFFTGINLSKTLDFIHGSSRITATYTNSKSSMVSQGLRTRYISGAYSIAPLLSGSVRSYLNWDLKFSWSRQFLNAVGLNSHHTDNFLYQGRISLFPWKIVTITANGEFYRNEVADNRYKNLFMLDAKLTFNVSKKIEISAALNNILNHKIYSYTTYGTLSSFESSSTLRGRELLISVYLKK